MELTKILFNPWIAGIILSAIMAAVMSTLSCQLLVCSSALTEDFYRAFLRPNASQTELVWTGRIMVMLISLIAIVIALNPDNKVLSLVAYAWAGFGAAFGPVILLSLFWKRFTFAGAAAGIVVGAAVDIRYTLAAGAGAVLLIFLALAVRSVGVALSLTETALDRRERLFCVISYLPKATVQAAIGSVPMALGLPCGKLILSVAVLAILITAPLGALGMDATCEKLLEKEP